MSEINAIKQPLDSSIFKKLEDSSDLRRDFQIFQTDEQNTLPQTVSKEDWTQTAEALTHWVNDQHNRQASTDRPAVSPRLREGELLLTALSSFNQYERFEKGGTDDPEAVKDFQNVNEFLADVIPEKGFN